MKARKHVDIRLPHLRIPLWWPDLPGNWRAWLPSRGSVLFTLLVVGGLLWAGSVGALSLRAPAANQTSTGTIAYQGRLADSGGDPITDTVNMEFRLYETCGGVPLWEEHWTGSNGVQVSDGLFNVMLGSLTPIPQSVITGHDTLFLGITVGTDDEMRPCVQLGSVPFAVQALTVSDGSVTTAKIADGAVTQAKLGADVSVDPPPGSITTEKLADGAVTTTKIAEDAVTPDKAPQLLATYTNDMGDSSGRDWCIIAGTKKDIYSSGSPETGAFANYAPAFGGEPITVCTVGKVPASSPRAVCFMKLSQEDNYTQSRIEVKSADGSELAEGYYEVHWIAMGPSDPDAPCWSQ